MTIEKGSIVLVVSTKEYFNKSIIPSIGVYIKYGDKSDDRLIRLSPENVFDNLPKVILLQGVRTLKSNDKIDILKRTPNKSSYIIIKTISTKELINSDVRLLNDYIDNLINTIEEPYRILSEYDTNNSDVRLSKVCIRVRVSMKESEDEYYSLSDIKGELPDKIEPFSAVIINGDKLGIISEIILLDNNKYKTRNSEVEFLSNNKEFRKMIGADRF